MITVGPIILTPAETKEGLFAKRLKHLEISGFGFPFVDSVSLHHETYLPFLAQLSIFTLSGGSEVEGVAISIEHFFAVPAEKVHWLCWCGRYPECRHDVMQRF
jgi:hypothetical protein